MSDAHEEFTCSHCDSAVSLAVTTRMRKGEIVGCPRCDMGQSDVVLPDPATEPRPAAKAAATTSDDHRPTASLFSRTRRWFTLDKLPVALVLAALAFLLLQAGLYLKSRRDVIRSTPSAAAEVGAAEAPPAHV